MIPLSPDPKISLKYHLEDLLKDEKLAAEVMTLVEESLKEHYQKGYSDGGENANYS